MINHYIDLGFKILGRLKNNNIVLRLVQCTNDSWNASKGAIGSVKKNLGGIFLSSGKNAGEISTDFVILNPEGTSVERYVRRVSANLPQGQKVLFYNGYKDCNYLNNNVNIVNGKIYGGW